MVHPITGPALLGAIKADFAGCELSTDQFIEPDPPGDHVTPENGWRPVPNIELNTKVIVCLFLKESDLALIVFFKIKEPISLDPLPRNAPNRLHLNGGISGRLLSMMTEEIVAGRDIKMGDLEISLHHKKTIG